jgi:type IV pilus assembly protein PilY1
MTRERFIRRCTATLAAQLGLYGLIICGNSSAQTVTLADQPVFASADVPGNLALVLSVEFPTATSVANLGDYNDATSYVGYFDATKCYTYVYNSTTPASSYFKPAAFANGTNSHSCSSNWSGNFMNWAVTPTIDPFRWALTGGYRLVDTTSQTILQKAWASTQAGLGNFPLKGTTQATGNSLNSTLVPKVTPFSWGAWTSQIASSDIRMTFYGNSASNGNANYQGSSTTDTNTNYTVYVNVSVCDTSTLGFAGLESNCVGYGTATSSGTGVTYSIYKPEGLMQKYSNKIRYSTFSYLNGLGTQNQGGVLREKMGFIGPTYPTPLSTTVTTNPNTEWSASTGIQYSNPDPTSATASAVSKSGNINFLDQFGLATGSYETYDNVSELYYAAVRYFEYLGNVPEWTNVATAANLDGFPAITTWDDPILYSCQKNFILGIGDDHTWVDYNVGGAALAGNGAVASRPVPSAVSSDSFNKASTWLAALQQLEGITPTDWWNQGMGSTQYIAGLAYGTHVVDIRPDDATKSNTTGLQTISTYWMDVAEYQEVENLNPYYLATKYGGFTVPSGYAITNTTPLTLGEYDTTGNNILMNGGNTHPLPDNYFEANNATNMVTSLASAFTNIANASKTFNTSFSLPLPTITSSSDTSFASSYNPNGWTGTITANTLTLAADGTPTLSAPIWSTDTTLQSQLAGTGWRSPGRLIATWNGSAGIPFEAANLSSTQLTALTPTSYATTVTSTQFVNYMRGDQTNEVASTTSGSSHSLRTRSLFLGDVVDAQVTPVGTPSMSFSEAYNVGYAAFKSAQSSRPTMAYVAANDGMLHAFVGTTGAEQFAYVPSQVITGPSSTPQVNGMVALGNPNFTHHYYVDATPLTFDIDFGRTQGSTTGTQWHTLLIGGQGKGGKSFYAIDVTNPSSMTTESAVAGNVLWEFTASTMGYSFGAPVVVKTAKYGWVVIFTSGYNNSDGYGHLYIVNPMTGALLETVTTPSASSGMTQAAAFVQDYTNFTADSIYVGDLNGQLWRFNLTGTSGLYPAPTLLATLTDASGTAQPITSAPLIEIHPTTRKRYVMVGTGKLLASTDIASSQVQTFYAILDGTAGSFNTVTTPITRANLTALTDLDAGVSIATSTPNGWYYDLGASNSIGWRVVSNPIAYNGIVAFTALLTNANACTPKGSSEVFAINYATGKSVLQPSVAGNPAPTDVALPNAVTNLKFVSNGTQNPELLAGDSKGTVSQVNANLLGTLATRILNWREIPTVN